MKSAEMKNEKMMVGYSIDFFLLWENRCRLTHDSSHENAPAVFQNGSSCEG